MNLGIISDLMNCSHIAMAYGQFTQYRDLLLANVDGRIDSHYTGTKRQPYILSAESVGSSHFTTIPTSAFFSASNAQSSDPVAQNKKPVERFVNVVCIEGPMTRNGAECSYGTKQIRDIMLEAASDHRCAGHIIYCDTPGGMVDCLADIRQAIDFAHEHGQAVDMLIDGYCASCGAFTAAMCDHVWFTADCNQIGSIGMYAAWFSLPDGAENKITSEVYHEVYASASTNKNGWKRLADAGDYTAVQEDLDRDLDRCIAYLKADRPSIADDQCHGDMYDCASVIGTLVDGKSDLRTIAQSLIADFDQRAGSPIVKESPASSDPTTPDPSTATVPSGSAATPLTTAATSRTTATTLSVSIDQVDSTSASVSIDHVDSPSPVSAASPADPTPSSLTTDPEEIPVNGEDPSSPCDPVEDNDPEDPEDGKCNPEKKDGKCNPENKDGECDPENKDAQCNPDKDTKCNPDPNDAKCNPDKDCTSTPSPTIAVQQEPQCGDSTTTPTKSMKEYPALTAALSLDGAILSADTEGCITLQPEQADALEALHAAHDTSLADSRIALDKAVADLSALNKQMEELRTQHAAEIASLKDQLQATVTESADFKRQFEESATQMTALNEQLTALRQRNADLQTTITVLNESQGAQPKAGETPVNNGKSAPAQPRIVTSSAYDPTLSAEENYRRHQATMERLKAATR